MTGSRTSVTPCTHLLSVRERTCSSLERTHPRRSPRERVLLLADEPALGYFQECCATLGLQEQWVCARATPETVVATCRERIQKTGPFQRIFLLMEWDGREGESPRLVWQQIRELLVPPQTGCVRLIGCRPSFLLWILLHFEEPGAEAEEGQWVRKRVGELLADSSQDGPALYSQTCSRLDVAMQRSMRMTRERLLSQSCEDLFPGKAGVQVHEIMTFLRKRFTR